MEEAKPSAKSHAKTARKAPPADIEAERIAPESAEPVKKGPVKAKKTATIAEDGAETVVKEVEKKKRGRPKKEVVEKDLSTAGEGTTKKGRGKKGTA